MADFEKTSGQADGVDLTAVFSALDQAMPTEFRRQLEERSPVAMPDYLLHLFDDPEKLASGAADPHHHTREDPDLIYGQSVSAFLQVFEQQGQLPVLDALKQIWTDKGFLTPDKLVAEMMALYLPDIDPAARQLLAEQVGERLVDQEPLTGFQRKQHAPLLTGLSHLFAVVMDKPVTLVLADYSNMGGTNEFFRDLIAQARGCTPQEVPDEEAFKYTDDAARITARLAESAFKRGAAAAFQLTDLQVFAYRTGGDELAFVCHGLTEVQTTQLLHDYVEPAIEDFTAEAGLQRHPHGKHKTDRWRDGFGVSFAAMALDAHTRPGKDMEYADARINENKAFTGMKRRGSVPPCGLDTPEMKDLMRLMQDAGVLGGEAPEATKDASTPETPAAQPQEDLIEMADGLEGLTTAQDLKAAAYDPTQPVGSKERLKAHREKQAPAREELMGRLRNMGGDPEQLQHLKGEALLNHVKLLAAQQLESELQKFATRYEALSRAAGTNIKGVTSLSQADAKKLLTNINKVMDRAPHGTMRQMPPKQDRHLDTTSKSLFRTQLEREHDTLSAKLTARGVVLDPQQRSQLEKIIACFSPIDPATKTLMGDLMPEIFGRFAEDAASLRGYVQKQATTGNAAVLGAMGIASPNEIKARGLCVALHNLGGGNALLGHKNADIILHHFASHIVEGSFKAAGINPNSVEVGHEGGGRLVIAVRPFVERTDGGSMVMNDAHMHKVQTEINRRIQEMQNTSIESFIKGKGGVMPDRLPAGMLFKQIEDPKRAYYPGMDVTTAYIELNAAEKGGRNRDHLVKQTESRIAEKRDAMQVIDQLKTDFQGRVRIEDRIVHFSQPQTETPYGQKSRPADQELRGNPVLGNRKDGTPSGP